MSSDEEVMDDAMDVGPSEIPDGEVEATPIASEQAAEGDKATQEEKKKQKSQKVLTQCLLLS